MFIDEKIISQIIDHSKRMYPREACGIIAGRDSVEVVHEMTNISETPELCYLMDPQEQLKVFKELRNLGLKMIGIYHSHPKSEAFPSTRDCELAFYTDTVYAIVSLEDFKNPEVRFFKVVEGKTEEIK